MTPRQHLPEPPTVALRPARRGDLPAIVAMRDRLNELERAGCAHASIQKLSLDEFTAMWGETLDSPNHCWRIAEANGQPVGFGLIYLSTPRTNPPGAYIHWAYLEPEQRRYGLGRLLLDALLQWARAKNANRVELQYIDGNDIAEQFWTKTGFQPYARKCVHYLG